MAQPPLTREEIIRRFEAITSEWDYGRGGTYGDPDEDIAKREGRADVVEPLKELLREIKERDAE